MKPPTPYDLVRGTWRDWLQAAAIVAALYGLGRLF